LLFCGVALAIRAARNRSKAYREESQLETKATTNITFMMIEFDLGGVSGRETKKQNHEIKFMSFSRRFSPALREQQAGRRRRKVRTTKHSTLDIVGSQLEQYN
jgi:hypothetical protein